MSQLTVNELFYAPGRESIQSLPCPSVLPLSCPEHNLKTLGDKLFKLHTVVEDIQAECSVKDP
jgi:hypothetical protein